MASELGRAFRRLTTHSHATIGGVFAIPMSQYTPFFGGWLVTVAQPWSPARLSTVGLHFFVFVLLGALALGGIAALGDRPRRRRW